MSFAEIADALMTMVIRKGATSRRIDVIFDDYRDYPARIPRERRKEITQETSTGIFSHIIRYSNGGRF